MRLKPRDRPPGVASGGHALINSARIEMFGLSAGGFTALVILGGLADLSKGGPMCREHPGDLACQLIARNGPAVVAPSGSGPAYDIRIKAAVVAAPALGYTFAPDELKTSRSRCNSGGPRTTRSCPTRVTPKRVGWHCRSHRTTACCPKRAILTSWRLAALRWPGLPRPVVEASPGLTGRRLIQPFNTAGVDFFDPHLKLN